MDDFSWRKFKARLFNVECKSKEAALSFIIECRKNGVMIPRHEVVNLQDKGCTFRYDGVKVKTLTKDEINFHSMTGVNSFLWLDEVVVKKFNDVIKRSSIEGVNEVWKSTTDTNKIEYIKISLGEVYLSFDRSISNISINYDQNEFYRKIERDKLSFNDMIDALKSNKYNYARNISTRKILVDFFGICQYFFNGSTDADPKFTYDELATKWEMF